MVPKGTVGKGIINFYDVKRGYGFIRPTSFKSLQIFFHVNVCLIDPVVGMAVEFVLGEGRKGPQALQVDIPQISKTVTSVLGGGAL